MPVSTTEIILLSKFLRTHYLSRYIVAYGRLDNNGDELIHYLCEDIVYVAECLHFDDDIYWNFYEKDRIDNIKLLIFELFYSLNNICEDNFDDTVSFSDIREIIDTLIDRADFEIKLQCLNVSE